MWVWYMYRPTLWFNDLESINLKKSVGTFGRQLLLTLDCYCTDTYEYVQEYSLLVMNLIMTTKTHKSFVQRLAIKLSIKVQFLTDWVQCILKVTQKTKVFGRLKDLYVKQWQHWYQLFGLTSFPSSPTLCAHTHTCLRTHSCPNYVPSINC